MKKMLRKMIMASALVVLSGVFPLAAIAGEKTQDDAETAAVSTDIILNDEARVIYKGDHFRLNFFGSSSSQDWQQLVLDSVPFRMPEEGTVLMLRTTKLGSPLEMKDLSALSEEFKLYNMENGAYLLPVGLVTVDKDDHDLSKPHSSFDMFFYDGQYAGDSGYALLCEDEYYSLDGLEPYSPSTKLLRDKTEDVSELPQMPEPGSVSASLRPEYALQLEEMLEKSDNRELPPADAEIGKNGKMVVAVFSSYGSLNDCSLDEASEENILSAIPAELLAENLDEADYVMLVHSRRERAGQYGVTGGAAWKVYTLLTVINPETMEEYETITVSASNPPESIRTNGMYSGGAEGNYEPEKAIEYILEMMQ